MYRLDDGAEQVYEKPLRPRCIWPKALTISSSMPRIGWETERRRRISRSWWIASRRDITLSIHGPQFTDKGVRYVTPEAEIELASRDAVAGPTPVRYGIDGAPATTIYTAPFHLPAVSGIHHLRMEADDPVNNHAQVNVDDIYVDHLRRR